MNRAYSMFQIKAIDEEKRIITGIATTPTADRAGDIVEPEGAQFQLPMPFLFQHDSGQPIGHVTQAKVTAAGIEIVAELVTVDEDGTLKQRLDEAWQSIKYKLVQGLSIGFREIEYARIEQTYSYRYIKWLWLELSAVTIPANGECTIQTIKSADRRQLAASGRKLPSSVRLDTPGASGKSTTVPKTKAAKEANEMKTIAEQIAALEKKRNDNTATMQAVMQKSIDAGRSTDAAEQEEFDTLSGENDAIDGDLKRLKALEKSMATKVTAIIAPANEKEGADLRGGGERSIVKMQPKLEPGIGFARLAKVKGIAYLARESAIGVAERIYGSDSEIAAILKAAVTAGSNANGNWAAALTGSDTKIFADFAAFLRPATILGQFGQNGVPGLRTVPFKERLISQTGGGAGYWVGEGKPKPMTAFNFAGTTLDPLKVANIAVLTQENIRSSSPNSEIIIRDALRDALVATQDTSFIDPANAGTANVKPASITHGAAAIASTGTDEDAVDLDVRAVFQKFIDADNPPENGVWIMSTSNALALSLMKNALGQRAYPNITMKGGIFSGLPVIASRYSTTNVALVNASDIYEADEGDVEVDMSTEASLEMSDAPTQDGAAGTGASLVSLWQNNLAGFRAEKTINWKLRRASAVAYVTGAHWGGNVPAS